MLAYIHEFGQLKNKEITVPTAEKGQVIVQLKTAGMNRRDLYIQNLRSDDEEALVLGSDGAGVIESIGEGVKNVSIGDEVIINPSLRWFENSIVQPKDFGVLGMPEDGTFAEKIVISADQVEPKPSYLTWKETGVVALAGLTGYRAMFTQGNLQAGETVFIPGAGSGVATYLIQFAKNIGARVIVTSRSEEKRQRALELGADLALDTNGDWQRELKDETIDLVIESVGRATFNRSLEILKHGGRMVVFGATTEDTVDLNLRTFFYNQHQLIGSTMGSREELRDMLAHMEKYQMRPVIDKVFKLEDADEAFEYLQDSQNFGKVVFEL